MFKVSLICYHANIKKIYLPEWVEQFKQSILNQTYKDFDILEICYSGGGDRIFENSKYENTVMPSFIHAMNHLINKAIYFGAEAVGNLNCDDQYSHDWLKVQLPYIKQGYDIVSPNFTLTRDGVAYHWHHFENLNIKEELNKNHNPLCHPAIVYSRKFLEDNRYIPEEGPYEDMKLWQRTIDYYKFKIVSENLLLHRIHENSVCRSENR